MLTFVHVAENAPVPAD